MRIVTYLNVTPEEINSKSHNIWIGVSLGNKYFTKENLDKYIRWAIDHTKENILVVIADTLHAVNLEVLDHRNPEKALKKAIRIGDEKNKEIEEIISNLSDEQKKKVRVVRWNDSLKNPSYLHNVELVKNEFRNNPDFHKLIIGIVNVGRADRSERLSNMTAFELDNLANYILYELPHFVNGVQGYGSDTVYTVLPYPGLNKLDELCVGLSNRTVFPELAKKLNVSHKIGILEAYVD